MVELLASLGLSGPEFDETIQIFDQLVISRENHIVRGFARVLRDISDGTVVDLEAAQRAARRALLVAGLVDSE